MSLTPTDPIGSIPRLAVPDGERRTCHCFQTYGVLGLATTAAHGSRLPLAARQVEGIALARERVRRAD